MITIIVWHCSPAILNYPGTTIQASVGQMLHGLMLFGIDVLVVSLGMILRYKQMSYGNTIAFIFKIWLLMVLTGLCLTFLLIFVGRFEMSDFYTALFPILRNEVPILSGIIVGIIIKTIIINHHLGDNELILASLLLVLFLPFVFGTNMFFLNNLNNPLIYSVLFLIGSFRCKKIKHNFTVSFLLVCLSVLLMALMPHISSLVHNDLSTADRFTTVANPLLVLASYSLSIVFVSKQDSQEETYPIWLPILLVSINTGALSTVLTDRMIKLAGHSTFKLLIIGSCFAFVIFLFTFFISLLIERLGISSCLSDKVDSFFSELNGNQSLKKWLFLKLREFIINCSNYRNILITIFTSYFISFLSLILMNKEWVSPELHVNVFMMTIFKRQNMVILNAVIVASLIMFLWSIFHRYFVGLVTSVLLTLAWIAANRLKIDSRDEPIMPSELKMVKVWGSLLKMSGPIVWIAIFCTIILAVTITFWLERNYKYQNLSVKNSVISLIVLPLILLSSLAWNH